MLTFLGYLYSYLGDKIIPRKGYQIVETSIGSTEVHSSLIIERVSIMDFGAYTCLAVNKKGKAETTIRLHGELNTFYANKRRWGYLLQSKYF